MMLCVTCFPSIFMYNVTYNVMYAAIMITK